MDVTMAQEIGIRKWWARGRTSDEIAAIEGIPAATVRYIIEHMHM